MGMCPVIAATALSILGLGILAPVWMWLSAALLVAGLVGLVLDFRRHRSIIPMALFAAGGTLLWLGRYSPLGGTGWQGWPEWGSGGLLVLAAFVLNLRARAPRCAVKPAGPPDTAATAGEVKA